MCVLESERLILRPHRPTDIEAMAVWLSDYDVSKMLLRIPHPYREDDAEAFIAREPSDEQVFVIERKADGVFLGSIGINPVPDHEFGYWLGKPYLGFGYTTEAARRLVTYAFERFGVDALRSGFFADNPASGHVLAKLGARHNGSRLRFSQAGGRRFSAMTCC
jgi:ribosomal-protein-alanine N-acetyltransferase